MINKFTKKYHTHILLFTGSFIIRIAFLCLLFLWVIYSGAFNTKQQTEFPVLSGDSQGYYQIAKNLVEQKSFSMSYETPLKPNSFRTPGYPGFLAAFLFLSMGKIGSVLVQLILGSATVLLIYMLAAKFLPEKIALTGAILLAIEPYGIFISSVLLTETLFVFLLVFSLYLFLSKKNLWQTEILFKGLSGLTLGLATLTRPVSIFLIPLASLIIVISSWRHYRAKSIIIALFFLVCAISPLIPWMVRNHNVFGIYELSSNGWSNLLYWNVSSHKALKTGQPLGDVVRDYGKQISPTSSLDELKSLKWTKETQELAIQYLHDNLLSYTIFHGIKTIPFFVSDGLREIALALQIKPKKPLPNFTNELFHLRFGNIIKGLSQDKVYTILFFIGFIIWTLISILMMLGIFYGLHSFKNALWFIFICAGLVIYFAVISAPLSPGRMRIMAEPFMFILVAIGIEFVRSRFLINQP